jgi:hypothetical protein
MNKTYSAQDFRKALVTSALDERPALEGMVKTDEQDEGVLLFSPAGCERWTPIPLDLVAEVEHLGSARCKDHQHPRVRIHLELPKTPEARVLAGLLAARPATPQSSRHGQDCDLECGADYQSCVESCDPRDQGCYYGCKRWLSRCLRDCR